MCSCRIFYQADPALRISFLQKCLARRPWAVSDERSGISRSRSGLIFLIWSTVGPGSTI